MKLIDGKYYPENATQASMFVGKRYEYLILNSTPDAWQRKLTYRLFLSDISRHGLVNIRFPLSALAEVCAAKEGMPVFCWDATFNDEGDPGYSASVKSMNVVGWHFLAANAITIGLNVGELRTLMEAIAKEESGE